MNEKLVLIDGHSILNRAFYGVPDLTNSEGFHTNAIYGFLNILFKVLEDEKAQYLMVAFDVKAPTFRHEIYNAYKGTRKPMPEELRQQVPVMKDLLKSMGIKVMEQAGLEADDILGTMAKRSEKKGLEVVVVSGDRDLLQLASEHIKIRMPKTSKGRTEVEDFYENDVLEKYQVSPIQIIELKALMGDSSDNIPGVPKIGEKTATELIIKYGNIENLKEHIDEIAKKSIKETLTNHFDLAELSKVLATINIDADISYQYEQGKIGNLYTKESYEYMKKLEFKNLLNRYERDVVNENEQKDNFKKITQLDEYEEIVANAKRAAFIGIQIIGEEIFQGISISFSEKDIYFIKAEGFLTKDYLLGSVKKLIQEGSGIFGTFYLKQELPYLQMEFVKNLFDIQLMAYLLNPLKNDYDIEDIAREHLGLMIEGRNQLFPKTSLLEAEEKKPEDFLNYVCFLSYVCMKSVSVLQEKLQQTQMEKLYLNIELPLVYCLFHMEQEGIGIRPSELKEYGGQLVGRIEELEAHIQEEASEKFNINSPKQLGEILFEKMKLPGGKKTKTGYSTAADVLEKLSTEYPFVAEILEYRGLTKLKSTYADGLATYITEDERIHSTFNQTITATGRISSTEPNLQNIPIRMELGRLIRKVFVPKDGFLFVDADYSQIELRILAHMSGDQRLIEAYNRDQDIHRITASEVFHTPFEEVTDLQRRNAKAVNFGIVYGISSFGLSQDLSISRKEASEYINKYFETYPRVKVFLEELVAKAKEDGYVTTMYGRRRPVPELSSSNFMQRSFGERVAMNAPIQGTAADIMKLAMLHVEEAFIRNHMKSKLILQVHDELLIETAIEEEEQVRKILHDEMMEAANLAVRLEIDIHAGKNWYEAK
ncbi:MAG: DNA polymerase I [Lachnospiraceae bacterium]|nr:DNA polymerase I [Lachnospiraceae bacterium]